MGKIFKKKNEFSKTIVILDITIFLFYVIINIIMMWVKGRAMPIDINTGVFTFLTGELGLLSFIKRSKIKADVVQPVSEELQQLISYKNTPTQNINSQGAAG